MRTANVDPMAIWYEAESKITAGESAGVIYRAIRQARREAYERAADVAENFSNAKPGDICEVQAGDWEYEIATAIRSLAEEETG